MKSYRQELYDSYVRVQVPTWAAPDATADKVWARATLWRLQDWLPRDNMARCLDVGCGAGHLLAALRSAGYTAVSGVDVGPEAAKIAGSKGLNVTQADLRDFLRRSPETFDLICAFDVIEHFHKDELLDVLRLVRERLKPGGILILQTPNALSPWAGHYRYDDLTHELIFSPKSIRSTLRLTGFGNVQVREIRPYAHGLKSVLRCCLWKLIWGGCALWNLAETGSAQGGVYSRNMLVRAVKEDPLRW